MLKRKKKEQILNSSVEQGDPASFNRKPKRNQMKPTTCVPQRVRETRRQTQFKNLWRNRKRSHRCVQHSAEPLRHRQAPWKTPVVKRGGQAPRYRLWPQRQHLPMLRFRLRSPKAMRPNRAEWTRALRTGHHPPEATPPVSKWKQIPWTVSAPKQIPPPAQSP